MELEENRSRRKGLYTVVLSVMCGALLFALLVASPDKASAQNPPPTPWPTPTPEPGQQGFIPDITVNDIPVPDPQTITEHGTLFRSRTVGIVKQFDAMSYTCPSIQVSLYSRPVFAGTTPEQRETNAYHVLLCRTKGVVDYMVLAGSGLSGFFLVWVGILHTIGSAQDSQRQGQETLGHLFRIASGYTLLIMCYLFTSVFFYTNIEPYLPYTPLLP